MLHASAPRPGLHRVLLPRAPAESQPGRPAEVHMDFFTSIGWSFSGMDLLSTWVLTADRSFIGIPKTTFRRVACPDKQQQNIYIYIYIYTHEGEGVGQGGGGPVEGAQAALILVTNT